MKMKIVSSEYMMIRDLTDIVEGLAKIVRELNPGADYGLIDLCLNRVDARLKEANAQFDAIAEARQRL